MLQRLSLVFAILLLVAACDSGDPSTTPVAEVPTEAAEAEAPVAEAPVAEAAEAEAPEADPAVAEAEEEVASYEMSTEIVDVDGVRSLVATVTPINGYKLNIEFPWNLRVAADAPVSAGLSQGRDDAAIFGEESARFVIPAGGEVVGDVLANMRLGVCNDVGCITPREELTWTLAAAL